MAQVKSPSPLDLGFQVFYVLLKLVYYRYIDFSLNNFNGSSQIWDRFSPDLSLLASTSKKEQQLEFKTDGGKEQHKC